MKLKMLFIIFFVNYCFSSDFDKGIKFSNAKNWSVSSTFFLKHLNKNPTDEIALYNLALNFYHQKSHIDALYYFEKAYKINPSLKECIQPIEKCRERLGLNTSWNEPFSPLFLKLFEIKLSVWSNVSLLLSVFSALFLFVFLKFKHYKNYFLILFLLLFFTFSFSIFITVKKAKMISTNTHVLVIKEIKTIFIDEKSTQTLNMNFSLGERFELLSNNNRIKIKLPNENVIYLNKSDVKLL